MAQWLLMLCGFSAAYGTHACTLTVPNMTIQTQCTLQKPNCFSKQLGYCSYVTISPSHANPKNAVLAKQIQSESILISLPLQPSILSITMGRIVLHYPSHANSNYLVES